MVDLQLTFCQSFSFRDSMLHYIRLNSKTKICEKLSKRCKTFYSLFPFDKIINDLNIYEYENVNKNEFNADVVKCQTIEQLQNYSTKIWLKNLFDLNVENIAMDSISNVILKCNAKIIRLLNNVSVKDFKLLTESGMVESLQVEEVIDANGNPIALEEIIISVPNARSIIVSNPNITNVTMDRLLLLNHNQKIESLVFFDVSMFFDLSKFFDFIKKNAAPEADITMMLNNNVVHPYFSRLFLSDFDKKMEDWKKS